MAPSYSRATLLALPLGLKTAPCDQARVLESDARNLFTHTEKATGDPFGWNVIEAGDPDGSGFNLSDALELNCLQ